MSALFNVNKWSLRCCQMLKGISDLNKIRKTISINLKAACALVHQADTYLLPGKHPHIPFKSSFFLKSCSATWGKDDFTSN